MYEKDLDQHGYCRIYGSFKGRFHKSLVLHLGQTNKAEFCKAALAQIKVVYILD